MITNVYFLHFSTRGCLKKDFVIEGISGLQNSFTWGSIYLSSLQNLWMCFSIIKSISLAKSHLISGSLRINLLTPTTLRYCITLPHKWKIRSVWNHTGAIIPFAHLCGFLLWNSYTTYLFKPAVRTAIQKKNPILLETSLNNVWSQEPGCCAQPCLCSYAKWSQHSVEIILQDAIAVKERNLTFKRYSDVVSPK